MKRIILMALLALALPMAAFADGSGPADFSNIGGTLSGSADGLSFNSPVIAVDNYNGLGMLVSSSPALGSATFTTGALTSGSLAFNGSGATFATGGTFVISGNGISGLPNGVIFSGTFILSKTGKPPELAATGVSGIFVFTGSLKGTFSDGETGKGAITVVVSINPNGTMSVLSGDTGLQTSTVPEPGTLGLMGTGLIGLAGALRRKLKA